ncbi:MAG: HEAT repeat domain-containing protein [Planctomycetes bacterium]|nr:HEAT repeat domain-containing protein [Planctomycetota bacterium]
MSSPTQYLGKTSKDWSGLLKDSDPVVRRLAAYALGEIGPDAKEDARELRSALTDPSEFVAVWAAAALARVDPSRPDAVAKLIEATGSKMYFVRSLAAWHLGRLGREHPGVPACLPTVERLLEDADPSVRTEAALALERLTGKKHHTWTPLC